MINLTHDEIRMILYTIDFVIDNCGDNKKLQRIYDKLLKELENGRD